MNALPPPATNVAQIEWVDRRRARSPHSNASIELSDFEGWQRQAIQNVIALNALPKGWDGFAGRPPTPRVIAWCFGLIRSTFKGSLHEPYFGPQSDGAIQITWWSGYNRELEFHVYDDGVVTFLKTDDTVASEEEGRFSFSDSAAVSNLITWLRRG